MDVLAFIDEQVKAIRQAVGSDTALVALSGGVDSSTVAVLGHRALGDRLDCLYIDDGLMRKNEGPMVQGAFANLGIKVRILDATERFFAALKGQVDAEAKRKAFRDTFYKTLGDAVSSSGAVWMLQGTIAADVIETQKGIKTQHNILEQIGIDPLSKYGLRILEPIRTLFKYQVREVARALGLPPEISERQPFPGPGLATRILGEVTPERVATVREAQAIVEEELAPFSPFQCLAVLFDDRATGIREGQRELGQIIAVRAVNSQDAMTASVVQLPWDVLVRLQQRICAEVPDVTKVLYDLTPKPPSTIEYI